MWVGGSKMFSLMVRGQFCKILNSTSIWRATVNYVQNHSFMSFSRRDANIIDTGTAKGFDVVPAMTEHRELLAQCLQRCYFRDEPLLRSVGFVGGLSPAFEDYVLSSIGEGLSFMAIGRSPEDILGMCINATMQHNEPTVPHEIMKRVGRHGRAIVEFDEFCYRQSDLFRRYFVSHLFDMQYLAVVPYMRRSGLAKALTARSLQLAKELGYPMACMHCTSQYSSRLAKSLGMSEAWSLAYNEYLNPKNKPLFRPPLPHTHVRMMVMNLE